MHPPHPSFNTWEIYITWYQQNIFGQCLMSGEEFDVWYWHKFASYCTAIHQWYVMELSGRNWMFVSCCKILIKCSCNKKNLGFDREEKHSIVVQNFQGFYMLMQSCQVQFSKVVKLCVLGLFQFFTTEPSSLNRINNTVFMRCSYIFHIAFRY